MSYGLAIATNSSYPKFSKDLYQELLRLSGGDLTKIPTFNISIHEDELGLNAESTDTTLDDTLRGSLSLCAQKFMRGFGVPIVTTDYNSSASYLELSDKIGRGYVKTLSQKPDTTIAHARLDAFNSARELFNPTHIGLFEPEKILGMTSLLSVRQNETFGDIDLGVLYRNLTLFKNTYPPMQYESEYWTNVTLERLMLLSFPEDQYERQYRFDFMGGMRIVGKNAFHLFEDPQTSFKLQPNEPLYGAYSHLMLPIIQAKKEGLRVKSEEIYYMHPPSQMFLEIHPSRVDWYNSKRKRQRDAIIRECGREVYLKEEQIFGLQKYCDGLIGVGELKTHQVEQMIYRRSKEW